MPLFKNRPLCALSALFLLSIFLSVSTDGAAIPYLAALSVLSLLVLLLLRRYRRPRPTRRNALFLLIAALVLLFSLLFSYLTYLRPERRLPIGRDDIAVEARIEEVLFESRYAFSCYASLTSVEGAAASGRVLVEGDFGATLSPGMTVSLRGTLSKLEGKNAVYRKADGAIALIDSVREFSATYGAPTPVERFLATLRDFRRTLSNRLASGVEGESGRLLSAMLLGEREELSSDTVRDFRRLGLSHILAISGLHLQILIYLFNTALTRLGLRRKWVLLLSIGAILFYVAMIGFTPSAMRAGLMAFFFALSFLVREQSDSLTSLFLTATVIILLSPATAYDVGFLLSCFATFGILLMGELKGDRTPEKKPFPRVVGAILSSLFLTVCATLSTLPITAFFFGEFSLLSPLANLILTPLFSLYLTLSPIALLFGWISPIGNIFSTAGGYLLSLVSATADLSSILIDIHYPDFILLTALGAASFFLLLFLAKRRRTLAVAGTLILSLLALCLGAHTVSLLSRTEVHYENAEKNEYLLLLEGNKALLCDITNGSARASREARTLLRSAHLCELDGYLLTHYHSAHPSTLDKLLGSIKVNTLYLPTPLSFEEERIYKDCSAVADEHGVQVLRYDTHETITFEKTSLCTFGRQAKGADTHPPLALTLLRGKRVMTYLGPNITEDFPAEAAAAVAKSDALIFGEHGPRDKKPILYTRFSEELFSVTLSDAKARLEPSLYSLLSARNLLSPDPRRVVLPLASKKHLP